MSSKQQTLILVLIVILRLCLVMLPSFKIDMNDWQAWSARLIETTPINFYSPNYFSDYFPGYLYLLWFLGASFNFLFPHLSIFSSGFEIYLKLFTNIFDFATAYYIYKIVSKYQKRLGLSASIFYLANPALAFNSSIWGQVDGILTFFLIYFTYCLLELKNIYLFSIFSALSVLIKPQGLAIFPVIIVHLIRNFKISKYINLLLIPTILILLSLPFFTKDPILGLFHLFQKSANTYPYTSMFSYNFWSITGWWVSDSTKFLGISYQYWGIFMFLFILTLIIIPLFILKGYKKNILIYFAMSLASFAFFLFLTRIHQRYLFPFFSFLLITVFVISSLKLKIIYLVLSSVHLINLWYVYYYYNYVYSNSNAAKFIIYNFFNMSYNWLTLINLVSFGVLMLIFYRLSFSLKNVKQTL